MTDTGKRRIARDACTWCGHRPHDDACRSRIQVEVGKTPTMAPCPCVRHLT